MGGKVSANTITISKSIWISRLNGLKDKRHPITRSATLQKFD